MDAQSFLFNACTLAVSPKRPPHTNTSTPAQTQSRTPVCLVGISRRWNMVRLFDRWPTLGESHAFANRPTWRTELCKKTQQQHSEHRIYSNAHNNTSHHVVRPVSRTMPTNTRLASYREVTCFFLCDRYLKRHVSKRISSKPT